MTGNRSTKRSPLTDSFWLGDWFVQISANRLSRGRAEVKLEPITMKVLVCLAERAGEVVTRDGLEAEVWPRMIVGYDSLNNAIAKLRKAFNDDPHQPKIIETIPKVGYRLIARISDSSQVTDLPGDVASTRPADPKPISLKHRLPARKLLTAAAVLVVLVTVAAAVAWFTPWDRQKEDTVSVSRETPLPEKFSIAVLPFENLSGDPDQAYFSDGITDDLITDLSKISGLFVIARNSTFTYKGKPMKARQVAEELGVRYVLGGSVRRARDKVRINVHLIDGSTGAHLWAERYDGLVGDVFSLQDKVRHGIVAALRVQLTPQEQVVAAGRDTNNIAAYDTFLKGRLHLLRKTPEDAVKAIAFFKQALELDSHYSRANAALAQIYWEYSNDQKFNTLLNPEAGSWGPSGYVAYLEAWEFLQIARSEPSAQAHALTAGMLQRQRRFDEAMEEARQAVALGPNDPAAYDALIEQLIYAGEAEEAIRLIDESIGLDPNLPGEKLFLKGMAHYAQGRLEEANSAINRARVHNPKQFRYAAIQAAALAGLGRVEEAEGALEDYLSGWVTYSALNWAMFYWPFQRLETLERLANGLIKAGMTAPLERYYRVAPQNRLTVDEIKSLLSNKTMIGGDQSYFGIGGSELEVTRNEDAQIVSQGYMNYFSDGGKTRVEDDLLCDAWRELGDYCVAIYRNPDGSKEKKDEYIFFTLTGLFTFSVFDTIN